MLGFAPLSSEASGSQPHSGAANLATVATLAADADLQAVGGANLSASSVVQAFGGRVQMASASLVGRASLAADIDVTYAAAALTLSSAELLVRRSVPIRGVAASIACSSGLQVFGVSLFDDLINNPSRRRVYAIEIEPALLVPYEELAA